MPSLAYQKDGSCVITRDDGAVMTIPAVDQSKMDALISDFIGPQPMPEITDQLTGLISLLVQKGVIQNTDVVAATGIDMSVFAPVDVPSQPLLIPAAAVDR